MRISDWSSDVCSSDLVGGIAELPLPGAQLCRRTLRHFHRLARRIAVQTFAIDAHRGGDDERVDRPFRQRLQQCRRPEVVHADRSEEHTSELQSLMRNSYAVFCLKKKNNNDTNF